MLVSHFSKWIRFLSQNLSRQKSQPRRWRGDLPMSPRITETPSVPSKDQFQRELDFPVGNGGRVNQARGAYRRPSLIEERAVVDGRFKVGMIEHIEKLCPELQVQVFLDFVIFE